MTKIFLDTEFLDDGERILLISLGLVAETGDEYYGISSDCDFDRVLAHRWLRDNVVPQLPLKADGDTWEWDLSHSDHKYVRPREQIAADVQTFMTRHPDPEIWAYFSPFDHVAMCQLYGPMSDLPPAIPGFTREHTSLPSQTGPTHHALADARHDCKIASVIGLI